VSWRKFATVECPACGARVGEQCRTASGRAAVAIAAMFIWIAFGTFCTLVAHNLVAAWGCIVCVNVWSAANYIRGAA
jgi:hypothetical protein